MHRRALALAALAVLAVLPACSNDTAPDPTAGKSHPAGTLGERISFDAGLVGIATDANGVGYVSTSLVTLGRFSTQSPYGKMSSVPTGPSQRDIVINRAGTTAYVATDNGKVYVVDLKTGTMTTTFAVGDTSLSGNATHQLALSPDGSIAYRAAWGRLWSIPTNGAAPTSVALSANAITVSPLNGSIYVNNGDYTTSRVDPSTFNKLATSTNFNGSVVAVAPGGDEVYVDSPDGALHVLDPVTLAVRGQLTLPSYFVMGMTVSPDGKQIYVALEDSRVAIVDRATRTVVSTLTVGGIPLGVAFDPTGSTAFVVNLQGWVDVIH